jgi:glutamyl-tRNA synthetase/nondiscriminating glutamyl-tRNA synthetase
LTRETAWARRAAGEAAAVRFRVPPDRDITFHDRVRGPVTFNTAVIGDPVIVRSDGRPAYNFAVVVDDAEMGVSDVVRGEDHISNTPRQILIYEAMGLTPPAFAHVSLVLGPDHAPLSKRHGATSVAEFRERGFLPEALVNYLALLGWSPGEGTELMSIDEMASRFDLDHVGHSAAVFDVGKLAWINRHYMKELPIDRMVREVWPYLSRAGQVSRDTDGAIALVRALLPMAIGAVDRTEEVPDRVRFVFDWDREEAVRLVGQEAEGRHAIAAFGAAVGDRALADREAFRAAVANARQTSGLKGRALLHPLRVALTAADSGPELDLAVPVIEQAARLGPEAGIAPVLSVASRLRLVLDRLGAGGADRPRD